MADLTAPYAWLPPTAIRNRRATEKCFAPIADSDRRPDRRTLEHGHRGTPGSVVSQPHNRRERAMPRPFTGQIAIDVRNSTQDWDAYTQVSPPEGSPNVIYLLWDDVGIATWDLFGEHYVDLEHEAMAAMKGD
jgi:hypothetical protein